MVGENGPLAIMSEIPLKPVHRDEVLELSRKHSLAFEEIDRTKASPDGSIAPCDVRMTGNAIMGSINWIPKWFHGDAKVADNVLDEFPAILSRGLRQENG